MLIYWQHITDAYLKLSYAMKCHVLFKHCQHTYCCPKHKANLCPKVIRERAFRNDRYLTSITLLQRRSVPKAVRVTRNSSGCGSPVFLTHP